MSFLSARATAVLTVATLVTSGLILLTGSLPWWAVNAGFIPLRVDTAVIATAHHFAVPAWATPLTATLVHGGLAHVALNMVMLVFCGIGAD
jgi:membrane associated rhomboid family serine protease